MYYNDFDESRGEYVWKVAEHDWSIEVSVECDGEIERIGKLVKRLGGDIDMPGYEMIVDEDLIDRFPDIHEAYQATHAKEAKIEIERDILSYFVQFGSEPEHDDHPEPDVICVKCGGVKVGCDA